MTADQINGVTTPLPKTDTVSSVKASKKTSWQTDPEVVQMLNKEAQLHPEDAIYAGLAETYKLLCLLGYKFNECIWQSNTAWGDKESKLNPGFIDLLKKVAKPDSDKIADYVNLFKTDNVKDFLDYAPDQDRNETVTFNLFGANGYQGLADLRHARRTVEYEVGQARTAGLLNKVDDLDGDGKISALEEFVSIREKYNQTEFFVVRDKAKEEIAVIEDKNSKTTPAAPQKTADLAKIENYAGAYSLNEDGDDLTLTMKEIQAFQSALEIMKRPSVEDKVADNTPVDNTPKIEKPKQEPEVVYKDSEGIKTCEEYTKSITMQKGAINVPQDGFCRKVENEPNKIFICTASKKTFYAYTLKANEQVLKIFTKDKQAFILVKQTNGNDTAYVLYRCNGSTSKAGWGTASNVDKDQYVILIDPADANKLYVQFKASTENKT